MNQTGVSSTVAQDFLDTVFLAESFDFPNELDGQPFFVSESFGVGSNLIAERLSEKRIVKNADVVNTKIGRHSFCITESWKRALNHNTVPTGKNSLNTIFVTFNEGCHRYPLSQRKYHVMEKRSSCLVPAMPG